LPARIQNIEHRAVGGSAIGSAHDALDTGANRGTYRINKSERIWRSRSSRHRVLYFVDGRQSAGDIARFQKLFPQVELVTVERSRTRLVTALHNGVIDVSIITGDPQPFDSKTTTLE
jgi:DNA-binding transcriptional LysR family regulator